MAAFQKRGGAWRAIVRRNGQTVTGTFDSRKQAEEWAVAAESKIVNGARVEGRKIAYVSVASLLLRYGREVSPSKKGERWEVIRLTLLAKKYPHFNVQLARFGPQDMAEWRDARLEVVSPASVNRELNLISAVFSTAIKEWRYELSENPVQLIRRPKNPPARNRRLDDSEIAAICGRLGWTGGSQPVLVKQWVAYAFTLAIETAMRKSEILNLTWEHVHLEKRYAHLPNTKNGESRDVPLSSRAIKLLAGLKKGEKGDAVVPISSGSLDQFFRRAVQDEKIEDLHFHDSRHEATTRMSAKLSNVLELASVTGHKTLGKLKIYYNPKPIDLAMKLG